MSKYIKIENCTNCIYCKYCIDANVSTYYWCTKQYNEIANVNIENNVFPDFCPLPNFENIND